MGATGGRLWEIWNLLTIVSLGVDLVFLGRTLPLWGQPVAHLNFFMKSFFTDLTLLCSVPSLYHVAYTNTKADKILLMGGEINPKTGIELPGKFWRKKIFGIIGLLAGGRTFSLHRPASSSCLIPLDREFVIVGGFDAGAAVGFVHRWENWVLKYYKVDRWHPTQIPRSEPKVFIFVWFRGSFTLHVQLGLGWDVFQNGWDGSLHLPTTTISLFSTHRTFCTKKENLIYIE